MTEPFKTGLVALSSAALVMAFAAPGWGQARGAARGSGGFSHAGGSARAGNGFSRAPMVSAYRAPVARVAPPGALRIVRPPSRTFAAGSSVRGRSLAYPRVGPVGTTRDRFGHRHRRGGILFLTPGVYPGYYYYPFDFDNGLGYDDNAYDTYGSDEATQQPDVEMQQPPPQVVVQPAPAAAASQNVAPAAQAPEPDAGQFILVRKDGRIVLATGFTISGDRLTYITSQGMRRSFPSAELDKGATRDMNDAAGNPVALSD